MARITTTAASFLSLILSTGVTLAQDDELTVEDVTFDRESVRCISSSAIRETMAVDNQTIIFRLRNGDYFINTLRSACEGLERENRISFTTPSGRLCNADSISVLRSLSGGSANSAGCGLRRFYPITQEEAELLTVDEEDRRGEPRFEVEDPNADDGESED